MVPVETFNDINFALYKDERFSTINSILNRRKSRSMIGYSQIIDSGSQNIPTTRTQILIDGLGEETYSTEVMWNPITNRINFLDAQVGDYTDLDIILNFQYSGLVQMSCQLDYSSALDGSKVIGPPETRIIFSNGLEQVAFLFTFKFMITQEMKDNGIGIMTISSVATTLYNSRLTVERLDSTTN